MMRKFPIIAGILLFLVGLWVMLIWHNFVESIDLFDITAFSPIRQNIWLYTTSKYAISLVFIGLGYSIYAYFRLNAFSLRILSFFYSVMLIDNVYTIIDIIKEIVLPTKIDLYILEKIIVEQPTLSDYLPPLIVSIVYVSTSLISLFILIPQLAKTPGASGNMKMVRLSNWVADVLVMSQILFAKFPVKWISSFTKDEVVLSFLLSSIQIFVYYAFFELIYNRTPGKLLTNTCVYSVDDTKPSAPVVLLRTLVRLIPIDFLSFLFGGNWHDKFSKTRVR